MTNITNLQRDGVWLPTLDTLGTWSAPDSYVGGGLTANFPLTVAETATSISGDRTTTQTLAANQSICMGVLIRPPGADVGPYRVRAYASHASARLVVGYPPATPTTGVDEVISTATTFPMFSAIDELLMIAPLDDQDTNYGRPLFFGIAIVNLDNNAPGTTHEGMISVQRLATAPPQFAQSTS